MTMTLPYSEPLVPREPAERIDPGAAAPRRARRTALRDLRRQDDDGRLVGRALDAAPAGRRQPARRGLAGEPCPRRLVRRPARTSVAADFGRVVARVERAILSLGDIARVHLYRWGDGGAHFHVWLIPRPLGMVEAAGMMLPIWEDVAPERAGRGARSGGSPGRLGHVTVDGALARRLGTGDAVVIGLGSMIGAGVFSAFAPGGGGGRQRPADRAGARGRASRTATPSRLRSSPRSTRPPAARTSTGASASASGGGSSRAGGSSSARPRPARRWR